MVLAPKIKIAVHVADRKNETNLPAGGRHLLLRRPLSHACGAQY
jgi:hypothetical protein